MFTHHDHIQNCLSAVLRVVKTVSLHNLNLIISRSNFFVGVVFAALESTRLISLDVEPPVSGVHHNESVFAVNVSQEYGTVNVFWLREKHFSRSG